MGMLRNVWFSAKLALAGLFGGFEDERFLPEGPGLSVLLERPSFREYDRDLRLTISY